MAGLAAPSYAAPTDHVLVVYQAISIKIQADGSSVEDRNEVLRALDAAGARALSKYSIPYQAQRQSVRVIEGSVVKGDDPQALIDPTAAHDEPVAAVTGAPAYKDARRVVVTLHNVVPGSVVRIHTQRTTRQSFLPGLYGAFDILPRTSPIQEASYDISAPSSMHLRVQANELQGGLTRDGAFDHWSYMASKLPSLYNVATTSDLLAKSPFIAISQADSTDQVATLYLRRTRAPQRISLELQQLADTLGADAIDPDVLIHRYYSWINDHVRLVDLPLEMGLLKPRKAEEILLSGYGTSEDRVIVLQALMGAKDLAADLALVPTLPVTWTTRVPATTAFADRVLLMTSGDQVLDIGAPVVALGEYGPRDRGKLGMRILSNGMTAPMQVPLQTIAESASSISTVITFAPDGSILGNSKIADFGDLAAIDRAAAVGSDRQAIAGRLGRQAPRGTSVSIVQMDDPMLPQNQFNFDVNFHLAGYQDPTGGYAMALPRPVVGLSPLEDFATTQGAGLCQRTWRQEDTEVIFQPVHPLQLPTNVTASAAGGLGSYTATYTPSGDGRLKVRRTLQLNANPLACDHQQQAALAALAETVRKDLGASLEIQR